MKKTTLLLAMLCIFAFGIGQNPYTINFQDESLDIRENIQTFSWDQLPEQSRLAQGFVGWVQFYQTPTQDIQDSFRAAGLELLEYIPHRTYLFYFPTAVSPQFLQSKGVRAIVPVEGRFKLEMNLKNGDIADHARAGNNLLVTLEFHKHVNAEFVMQDLMRKQISIEQSYKGYQILDLSIPDNCLEELSSLPYVKWVELIPPPPVKEDSRGRSIHRSNGLDTQTGAGRNYTGDGIGVMVRDDGIVGPHIDFEGRIDNSGVTGGSGTHGDGVGGIMAGAGNLNPRYRGMAAGSDMYVVTYVSNFLDAATLNLINNGDVQITNSSYSNGCNAGYTSTTRTVDQQTRNINSLLHVFSGGNSNNNNCGYGAGTQWGNITGGHKQGKNVIATANVFYDGELVNSSSRGPGHDGRIKPDITAHGQGQISTNPNNQYQSFGGTSGAAPGIAGVSAQLYEAYADANGGALPQSALIKAALLNTANDYGNVGPDFKFGWGVVNGLRAGMLIEDGRYLSDDIAQGNSNNHTINVPIGTTQVRFMLYWSDAEATSGANPALVNDLDLVVTDPSNNDYLPWILDHTPDPTLLNLPATNGPDHLNNMEQVLINSPVSGNYNLEISGFNVPVGPQEYFIVYEIIQENLTITYPNSGESFVRGEQEVIHWDAINTTNDFTLEYSDDNGGSWNNIATVPSTDTNYTWNVANVVSGEVKIRITSGTFSDESDDVFSITSQPTNINLNQLCPTEATFTWDAVPNAESYDFYTLGNKYMEVIGSTNTNSIVIPITNSNDPIWYAVVAKNATEGWTSLRTNAINHPGGLVNCTLNNDLAVDDVANDFSPACSPGLVTATISNLGIDDQSNFDLTYQVSGQSAVQETYTGTLQAGMQDDFQFSTPISFPSDGNYTITVTVNLTGDQNGANDSVALDFYGQLDATATPFDEPFDVNGMPPDSWYILNPDNATTWIERTSITGSDGDPTTAAYIDNFAYNAAGQQDYLVTEVLDLNLSDAILSFDLAKAQYNSSFSDALRVEISTDCGDTYESIYFKDGQDLPTVPNTTSIWTPTSASHWRTENIDLIDYVGGTAIFRFVNITGYGNSTFIDNINLNGTLAIPDVSFTEIAVFPNPASEEVFVNINNTTFDTYEIRVINMLGQTLKVLNENNFNSSTQARIDVSDFATGVYFIKLQVGDETTTRKLVVE